MISTFSKRPPPPPEDAPRQAMLELAPKRSHEDIKAANDTARAATQAAILINGGAATAILAYLSKSPPPEPAVLRAASVSLAVYGLGVALGAWAMWCSAQASAKFAYRWEALLNNDLANAAVFGRNGDDWLFGHRWSFFLSIVSFAVATWWIASAW
jgi:hypothetical protein